MLPNSNMIFRRNSCTVVEWQRGGVATPERSQRPQNSYFADDRKRVREWCQSVFFSGPLGGEISPQTGKLNF